MQPRLQRDAQTQPVCSRRIFLGSALAASATVVAGALAGCQRPSTLKVVQPTTGGGRDDLSDSVIGKDKIRIGMEAAYAPYNWQVSEASEFTIPIDNVQGAYADGYDVQIAKIVCKALGGLLPSSRASRALSIRSTTARSTSSLPA
jgi:putative lysine transport system substrate-binding protein